MDGKRSALSILFVVMTHGDEIIGEELLNKWPSGENDHARWNVIVGNPAGYSKKVRYTETDLNRSFNAPNPRSYEERRALELQEILSRYDIVYDIHSTVANMPDCVFVNEFSKEIEFALKPLTEKHVIVDKEDYDYFLTSIHPVGITLEYHRESKRLLQDFHNIVNGIQAQNAPIISETYKAVKHGEEVPGMKNFTHLTLKQKKQLGLPEKDDFFPVFIGQYKENYCFINKAA